MLFFIWFVLCVLAGMLAGSKGRSFFGFFLLSLFLSPLIGFIAALIAQPNTEVIEESKLDSGEMKKCPKCAEIVKIDATVCRYCGNEEFPKEPEKNKNEEFKESFSGSPF